MIEVILLGYILLRFVLRVEITGRRRRRW